jgi:hypothetical protein
MCALGGIVRVSARSRLAVVGLMAASITVLGVEIPTLASAAPGPNQSLSANTSVMYQTNNTVRSLAVSNGVVYAGGLFTSVRPPGSALGTNETPRTYLAAFSTTTGTPTSFDPTLNGRVVSVAVSADGSKLYIAGTFTKVNGLARSHFAAFDLATGAVDPSWIPSATGGSGDSLAIGGSSIYLGGMFTAVDGVAHQGLAAVSATTGALLPAFGATAVGDVAQMAVAPDLSRLIIVGSFSTLDGQALHGSASLNPVTGAVEPWAAAPLLPDLPYCTSDGTAVTIVGTVAYIGGDGVQPGCFDSDFAANISDGSVVWATSCEGATEALAVLNGVLYKGSHTHDCSFGAGGKFGGFTGALVRRSFIYHRLLAQNPADGSFEHWSPNTNGANGTAVGPYALATDGTQMFVGGDFTTINDKGQEGLARFAPGPSAAPAKPAAGPTVVPSGPGQLTVTFPAVVDNDNGVLSYTLFRGNTAVATLSAESWPWASPSLRYVDSGLKVGTAYTYHYKASDGATTTASSPNSLATTALASVPAYAPTILAASPSLDWRLDDSGSVAADASGHGATGQLVGGVSTGQPGAISGDSAVSVDGSTGYVTSNAPMPSVSSFTESGWFNTTTMSGGAMLGESTVQTGNGGTTNDVIWMDDDGQIVFAVDAPGYLRSTLIRSPMTYNDGHWHQVTASYDGTTMSLYVDGTLVASSPATASAPFGGYLRAGDLDLSGITHVFGGNFVSVTAPNSYGFSGSIDEVAVYPTALSASQISALWGAGALAP